MNALDLHDIKKEVTELQENLRKASQGAPRSPQSSPGKSRPGLYGGGPAGGYHDSSREAPYQDASAPSFNVGAQLSAVNSIIRRLRAIQSDLTQRERQSHDNIRIADDQHNKIHEVKAVQAEYQASRRVFQKEIVEIQSLLREIGGVLAEANQTASYLSSAASSSPRAEINAAIVEASTSQSHPIGYAGDVEREELYLWGQEQYGRSSPERSGWPIPRLQQNGPRTVDSLVGRLAAGGFTREEQSLTGVMDSLIPYKKLRRRGTPGYADSYWYDQ
ncbi:MAG: hypothetical protein GC154_16900 [bacterium]|nr:hypothetical protein [bacterium]